MNVSAIAKGQVNIIPLFISAFRQLLYISQDASRCQTMDVFLDKLFFILCPGDNTFTF